MLARCNPHPARSHYSKLEIIMVSCCDGSAARPQNAGNRKYKKIKIKCYKFSTFPRTPKSFQDSKSNTSHSMPQLQNIAELLTSSLSGTAEMIFSIIFILYIPAPAPLSCVLSMLTVDHCQNVRPN